MPKARLLTSDQCLAELEEKECNKKLAAEEKERKKKEREEKRKQKQELLEEKKRQREEDARKKAEEKLRKAEYKAKKTQEKAEARAKRQKASVSKTRSSANKRALDSESATVSEESMPLKRTRVASTNNASSGIFTRLSCLPRITSETDEEEIDPNVCCLCFVIFEEDTREQTGAKWLSCACGRWLHEDCAEDIVVDSDGNERCCPFCVRSLIVF